MINDSCLKEDDLLEKELNFTFVQYFFILLKELLQKKEKNKHQHS